MDCNDIKICGRSTIHLADFSCVLLTTKQFCLIVEILDVMQSKFCMNKYKMGDRLGFSRSNALISFAEVRQGRVLMLKS